jgi:hypothetical protein
VNEVSKIYIRYSVVEIINEDESCEEYAGIPYQVSYFAPILPTKLNVFQDHPSHHIYFRTVEDSEEKEIGRVGSITIVKTEKIENKYGFKNITDISIGDIIYHRERSYEVTGMTIDRTNTPEIKTQ